MIKVFNPFPILNTKRLVLRQIEIKDENDIFLMRSHPQMHLYTDTLPDTLVIQSTNYINRIQKGIENELFIMWAIELKTTKKVIGTISIWNLNEDRNSGELGYGIHPDYHRLGYMSEALISIINYSFDKMKLSVLEAYTEVNNYPSIQLLKKLQFQKQTVIVESGQNKNQDFHMEVYTINL